MSTARTLAAFVGNTLLIRGPLPEVVHRCLEVHGTQSDRVAIYDDTTGHVLDIDYELTAEQSIAALSLDPRPAPSPKRGRGRPRLGVVSREVSLLPRHWEWLSQQRGGASAALRRLVEVARKNEAPEQVRRRAIDAAHRFLWDIAGDQAGFEEATRALFAGDFDAMFEQTAGWPDDVLIQLRRYLAPAVE